MVVSDLAHTAQIGRYTESPMGVYFEICGNSRSRVSSPVLTFHGHRRHVWRTRTYQSALFLIMRLHDGYDGHTREFANETQNLPQVYLQQHYASLVTCFVLTFATCTLSGRVMRGLKSL